MASRLKPSMLECIARVRKRSWTIRAGSRGSSIGDGEVREVELFVMVLGPATTVRGSDQDTETSRLRGSTIRGFEHFGGVPEVIVPDQLRRR